jgi:hypothetical protein
VFLRRLAAGIALLFLTSVHAYAQDADLPQDSGSEYAWGERADRAPVEDPLRIMTWLGAGIGFRPLRNLDTPFTQSFVTPAYLDLAAAVFAPGTDVRHGGGLAVSTNVSADPSDNGLPGFQQWVITPSYHLLLPLYRIAGMADDIVQIQLRLGIPIVISRALATITGGIEATFGGELGLAFNFKFLAGLGMYLELQGDLYGGTQDTVHPTLSADAGFVIDYEVL